MVSLNRKAWQPLSEPHGIHRPKSAIGRAVREAAQQGSLAQLEDRLDLLENRQRRIAQLDKQSR